MYCFIVDPCRAISEKIWKQLERRLKIMNIDYRVYLAQKPGDARQFAREITHCGQTVPTIIAVGADGTINEILDGIFFAGAVTVGYIPVGRNNSMAKSLQLPRNPFKCMQRIISSDHIRYLDYGVLSYGENAKEHRRFAVSCSMGMEMMGGGRLPAPQYIRGLSRLRTKIRQLFQEKPTKGFIILDDVKKIEFNHIFLVTVHIQPYGNGGFRFAPLTDPGDGSMDICVIHHVRKLELGLILLEAFLGRLKSRKGVRFFNCREVQIHTERPMPVRVDGEDCRYQTDIHLRCVEKKIRMII